MADHMTATHKGKRPFAKPELHKLDITGTETGPTPDPTEFPGILQMS